MPHKNVTTEKLLAEAFNRIQNQMPNSTPVSWDSLFTIVAASKDKDDDADSLPTINAIFTSQVAAEHFLTENVNKLPGLVDAHYEVVSLMECYERFAINEIENVGSDEEEGSSPEADHELYNQIIGRLTLVAREAGYDMTDIQWYIDELEDSFEPSAYQNITDAKLLADFRMALRYRNGPGG